MINRRTFLNTTTVAGAGLAFAGTLPAAVKSTATASGKPAILGGTAAHAGDWPSWPVFDVPEEQGLQTTLKSGKWFRLGATQVEAFEKGFSSKAGSAHCVATASGTAALLAALGALDIGPGDEVIIPVYTFVATYNVVVLNHALPIFVDVDPATFQIDSAKLEAAITPRTAAIVPVHMGGNPANLDRILQIAKPRNIPVIEDCCQAHLAEWRGRMVGNWGKAGCFSFQASKNLNSGEGGAVLTNDQEFAVKCWSFHNQGRAPSTGGFNFRYAGYRASNLRLTEFQGAILQEQLARLQQQADRRTENADHLTRMLKRIPGISPAEKYGGCTRNAYHLYMFRYDKERFSGLHRSKFFTAMQKEGITCHSGYTPLHTDPYVQALASNKHYQRLYSKDDLQRWQSHTLCAENDKLCAQSVWLTQNYLLGEKRDMDSIAEAIERIQKHASEINAVA